MEAVQEAVRAGRCTDQQEEEAIEALGGPEAATYGELTPLGFRSMAARLELCAEDSFVDLGSGLGRMVLQAATEYGVRRACGVELAPSRHTLAQEARDRAHESVASRVLLVEGDCAAEDVWHEHLGDATVVFASNLLFGDELQERIAQRCESGDSLRVVASLKPFDRGLVGYAEEAPPVMCETSWRAPEELQQAGALDQAGSLVYIYRRVA